MTLKYEINLLLKSKAFIYIVIIIYLKLDKNAVIS